MRLRLSRLASSVATATSALLAACSGGRGRTVERVHPVGPFEIVTTAEQVTARHLDADLRLRRTVAMDRRYVLRYRGRPLPIRGLAGQYGDRERTYRELSGALTWNGLGVDPTEGPAALIALVRDENTEGDFFYLVREAGDQPSIEFLAQERHARVLDRPRGGGVSHLPPPGGRPAKVNANEYWDRVSHHDLTGGRLLYFPDSNAVLDLRTLALHRLRRPYEQGLDLAVDDVAVSVAPDGLSIVRLAFPYRGAERRTAFEELTLLETDLVTGASVAHPITASPMASRTAPDRAPDVAVARAAASAFAWTRDRQGRDRFVPQRPPGGARPAPAR